MRISIIDAGNFKLDGGAMFGVVPKNIWEKLVPADENNLCSWKMRCLLVEFDNKLVLIDTGMGDKQPQKWQSYYFKHGSEDLLSSIRKAGYHENQITDVILSHLHFDHCGGAVEWNTLRDGYKLTFENANYWTHSGHWQSAMEPNPREKATFLTENLGILASSGHLKFIDQHLNYFENHIDFIFGDGHTEKMVMPIITKNNQKIVFCADTIPSFAHVHIPYCMAYDVRPLQTMIEKETLLTNALAHDYILYFDHDIKNEAAKVNKNEKGFYIESAGNLSEYVQLF